PPVVSDVILKGIEVSQEKRFATAALMQKALRRAYTQTREAMSAKTAIYGMDKEPTFKSDDSVPDPKTEVLAVEPERAVRSASLPSELPTRTQPSPESVPAAGPATLAPAPMEATLQMSSAETEEVLKQADVKTEVLLAGDFPILPEIAKTPVPAAHQDTSLPTFSHEASVHKNPFATSSNE